MRLAAGLRSLLVWTVLVRAGLARVCPSIDVRNTPAKFDLLRNCTRIEGYLQVVLLETATEADFVGLSFPNLTEVTHFVVFFRAKGLTSIGQLFPNLSLIGGDVLSMNYALIISQMEDLKEINLPNLKLIMRGSVAIAKNPKLCFVNTVDWDLIASTGDNFFNLKANCPECPKNCPEGKCWSMNHCQVLSWGKNCHEECIGGCTGPTVNECTACKHFVYNKVCVPQCPPNTYKFERRQCISADECRNMNNTLARPEYNSSDENWFTWDNKCVNKCPVGLQSDAALGCKPCTASEWSGKCVAVCKPTRVESIQTAQKLKDCTIINGSLEIQINSGNQSFIYNELEENLGSIEEIDGSLKIARSFPLTSLNFLKNLRIIHGNPSWLENPSSSLNNSLIVLENQNLQTLWDWENRPFKRNFTIANGRIFFHYNPSLCLKHIEELASIAGLHNITNLEVERESNGNKFACNIIDLNVTISARFSTDVSLWIRWPSSASKQYNVMRYMYMIYYIKAPYMNLTVEFETSECGEYRWTVIDVSQKKENIHYTLHNLEPNTQYAFFVKTYTVNSTGGQSPIQYFKTRPSRPTWPNDLKGISTNSTSITLFWSPPDKANGVIKEYRITGFIRGEEFEMLMDTDFCDPKLREKFLDKKIETTPPLPEFRTITEEKYDCCKKKMVVEPVLTGDSLLCQNLPKDLKPISKFLSSKNIKTCDKYVYSIIEDSVIDSPATLSKRSVDHKLNVSRYLDFDNQDFPHLPFKVTVSGNTSSHTFVGLEPYSLYSFEVKVCRDTDPEFETPDDSKRCSLSSLVTVRTLKNEDSDTISGLTADVNNRTVELKWGVRNSMILRYDIEYRRTDIPNFKPTINCIKASGMQNKGIYSFKDLPLGKYSFRVRAMSLAELGPFSEPVVAAITEFSFKNIIIVVFLVSVFIFLTAVAILSILCYRKNVMLRQNILIATVNPDYLVEHEIDEEWELPMERIQIIKELKRGNFGVVCEGLLLPEEKRVAVKKVVETASERDRLEFLNEAAVMKQFTSAYHVVHLIGIVSRGRPQLVVMEMMDHGDLKSYLRESRNSIPPSPSQMILMAAQIADGMAFLEAGKYIHRDLAARNCMVRQDLVVKIGDFGMTRDVYQTDYYRKGNRGLLPIRWMSPESLNDGVFSSKSDSWSYGIVLWEMSTLAAQPYQGMSNEQVLSYVVSGNKLELPPVYPRPFKAIMLWCWKWKPKFRPTFLQILDELMEYTTKQFREVSFYDSPRGRIERESLAALPQQCHIEPSSATALYHPA